MHLKKKCVDFRFKEIKTTEYVGGKSVSGCVFPILSTINIPLIFNEGGGGGAYSITVRPVRIKMVFKYVCNWIHISYTGIS